MSQTWPPDWLCWSNCFFCKRQTIAARSKHYGICACCRMSRKPPSEWEQALGLKILDPDGWRRQDIDFDIPIIFTVFKSLMLPSTCDFSRCKITNWSV